MMLDEIDKVGADWRGDPSSALLEVLDPAQNHTFRDHYLDVDLDLSEVLFIATGNVSETIPGPLLDRMEVLRLDGYTEDEKVAIARHHLMPRQIERNGLREDEGLTLTGQLGDVMKESAQIALSFVRSHATELGIPPERLTGRFHVHVPAGAVPKDGPSAGVTMTTALVSLLSGETVKPSVGMTGEVTLQGRVLPIGGVKQKVLAAHRAGLTQVVLPRRNEGDLDDVPEQVREEMTFHLADDVRDVLEIALDAPAAEPSVAVA